MKLSRWFKLLLAFSVLIGTGVVLVIGGLVTMPLKMQIALAEVVAGLPLKTIEVDSIVVNDDGRLRVEGVVIRPPRPRAPTVSIAWAEFDPPSPERFLQTRELLLGSVHVNAIRIEAKNQQPPPPVAVPEGLPLTIIADRIEIVDGKYTAPADDPLGAVSVIGLNGTLQDMRWQPQLRRYEGGGVLSAEQVILGAIEVSDLTIPALMLEGDQLSFTEATVRYGDSEGTLNGKVVGLARGPVTQMDLSLSEARLEDLIQTATGEQSPLEGRLDVELRLLAGGPLERGHAQWQGDIRLRRGLLRLGEDVHWSRRAMLNMAPWVDLDDDGVRLHRMQGRVCFGRGWVQLDSLRYKSQKDRELLAWGRLDKGTMDFSVRTPPGRGRGLFKGVKLGLLVEGSTRKPGVKVVKPEDLSTPRPACAFPVEDFFPPAEAVTASTEE
ncbi:MAG: AsmA-like C-terminal region-containing protein [Myxococcota bacterium]